MVSPSAPPDPECIMNHDTIKQMELEENTDTTTEEKKQSVLNTITPLSRYLAMILFIALPFVGGFVGYTSAPVKTIEVAQIVNTTEKSHEIAQTGTSSIESAALQKTLESYNLRNNWRSENKYALYSIIAYKDSATNETILESAVLDKYPSDAEVLFRSSSPLGIGATVRTSSFYIFELYIDSALYDQTFNRRGSDVFSGKKEWYIAPLDKNGNPLFKKSQSFDLSTLGIHEDNPYAKSLYSLAETYSSQMVDETKDFSLQETKERDMLLILEGGCIACERHYYSSFIIVDARDLYDPPYTMPAHVQQEGYLTYLEWTGLRSFRYKIFPTEGDPGYDLECERGGMDGCYKSDINWNNVPWHEGSI